MSNNVSLIAILIGCLIGLPLVAEEGLLQNLEQIENEIALHESAIKSKSNSDSKVIPRLLEAEAKRLTLRAQVHRDELEIKSIIKDISDHVSLFAKGIPPASSGLKPDTPATEPNPIPTSNNNTPGPPPSVPFPIDFPQKPLAAKIPGIMRRVLTRPGAKLRDQTGLEKPLDTFSILYVYNDWINPNGTRWLAVGSGANKFDGWVPYDATEDWESMLVMEYSPRTNERRPVLFFTSKEGLLEVVGDNNGHQQAESIYRDVDAGGNAQGRILTVEPTRSVDRNRSYLMPILGHETTHFSYGDYRDVMLLNLAGLTESATTRKDVPTPIGQAQSLPKASERLKDFRIGIVFVIDTTRSMGPYINATKDFVRDIYKQLENLGLVNRFRFGLVGYRDNIEAAPSVGYVTRVFRTLKAPSSGKEILSDINAVLPSEASTTDWREDAFAGLRSAAYDLDWQEVDARILILVTDASARSETDEKAMHKNFGALSARAVLDQHDIRVHVFHLRTEEARRIAGEAEIYRAQAQYETLGRYWPIEGDAPKTFALALDGNKKELVKVLSNYADGREIEDYSNTEDPYRVLNMMAGSSVLTEETAELAAKPIVSDIFRYQQAYLGRYEGSQPPAFYRAWAADRDLISQGQEALTVSVLVSRGQLELLADAIEHTVNDVQSKTTNLAEFHSSVSIESGKATSDPNLTKVAAAFLESLPYKSKFLQISREGFLGLGQGQEDLLNEVRAKLTGYREILMSDKHWMRVSDTSEEELYPLPLRDLP